MVDLGISRTQDIQNPHQSAQVQRVPPSELQPKGGKAVEVKLPRKGPAEAPPAEARAPDLETEVKRLNDLMGASTRIRFVINRTNNDVYIEVMDKETGDVLKTIPPSELPAVAAKLNGGGILVDRNL